MENPMTDQITIRVPFSETSWGSCYVIVELKNGETAEQYLVRVRNDSAPLLEDAIGEEWTVEDSDSLSFDVAEAEIYHDD
jgi:hypothetical protein